MRLSTRHALATAFLLCSCLPALAGPTPTTPAGDLEALRIESGKQGSPAFTLRGRDSTLQLVVSGTYSTGEVRDLTREVRYQATPADLVEIDETGLVLAKKEGKATIRALGSGGIQAEATVQVAQFDQEVPIDFPNQIVPLFTKLGCNAGGCHGKADGQNGFKLSLFGFEPAEDHEFIVKEGRGRRVFPAAPDHSLILLKATGRIAHGGGKRLEPDSLAYRVLRRWIEQGLPYRQPDAPTVEGIEVVPSERILPRDAQQQLAVIAHRSDGSTVNVTRLAQFESNAPELAEGSATGLIHTREVPGVAAVMARFQSHVAVFRATIPLGAAVTDLPPEKNFIDRLVFQQWRKLGLPPSKLCDDSTFLRRVTIDLCGRLPTLEEARAFLAETDPGRYERLVDRLLASAAHADYFANKWSAILRNRRKEEKDDPKPTFAFHAWIRDCLHENVPYDEFVREIITASGEEVKDAPVIWYREVREPHAQAEDVAQLFLGQRIGCARCHHHPLEKWSQQDYYGMTAFFSQLDIKDPPPPKKKRKKGQPPPKKPPFTVAHRPGQARATHPRTGEVVLPTPLDGKPLTLADSDDPRVSLVEWMTAPENPFFARTLVNRYWKHFFSRGLVDPEDDMRVTNPPTNPELLDALASHFIEHKYDMKDLLRTICTSSVYRLSAVPNAYNGSDQQNFSRFLPRHLHAEVLLDAIDDLTEAKTSFKGVPAGTRAVQLPDNQFSSYFLSVFGRPESATACECERSSDATLAQTLHLLNSPDILKKVSGPRATELARDKRPIPEKLRDLYLLAYAREPSEAETKALIEHIDRKGPAAYADILWALINTKEFLFNH
jgi:hypothetical protein